MNDAPPKHYVALIGDKRIPTSATVVERYRKFYGDTWPIRFELVDTPNAPREVQP